MLALRASAFEHPDQLANFNRLIVSQVDRLADNVVGGRARDQPAQISLT